MKRVRIITKKPIKASAQASTFRVYFNDGNQKLFDSDSILDVAEYLVYDKNYYPEDIYKIEKVD